MSSSPTAPTSTTASSSNSPSRGVRAGRVWGVAREQSVPPSQQSLRADVLTPRVDVIACGALSGHVREIVARRGWPVTVRSLPAVLHNRPQKITTLAERAVVSALSSGRTVALAYADCGTYGGRGQLGATDGPLPLPGLRCHAM